MKPSPQRDNELLAAAFLLGIVVYLLERASRRSERLRAKALGERGRRLELEDELERREQQLNGALEKITELRGGQPAGDGSE